MSVINEIHLVHAFNIPRTAAPIALGLFKLTKFTFNINSVVVEDTILKSFNRSLAEKK